METETLFLNIDNMGEITGNENVSHIWIITSDDPFNSIVEEHYSKHYSKSEVIRSAKLYADMVVENGDYVGCCVLLDGNEIYYKGAE